MEVITVAGLKPFCLQKNSKNSSESKRFVPASFPRFSDSKIQTPKWSQLLFRSLSSGVALVSSVLGTNNMAKALTYEEALQQSVNASTVDSGGFDITGIVNFLSENPLVIGGGAVALTVPLVLSQILNKEKKKYGIESARNAYAKLSEDPEAQLLDIREGRDAKEVGSPDVKSLKKKAVVIAYRGEDKPGFLKKLSLRFKDPESTTLFILDKFDGNSELVAELVTANGFKAAYAIKDGAEGPRGWMNSGLPWIEPKKALTLDFGDLKDALSGVLGESSNGLPLTVGLAAGGGLGLLVFSEVETILQLIGSAAILQIITKKLLFSEDRKVTLKQVNEFLNTKVAPKELVDELKMIGKALLPAASNAMASLPEPAEALPNEMATASAENVEPAPETKPEIKAEATVEPAPAIINSVPKAEVREKSVPVISRPLSPYPYYPDFKPPSSPCPSQP